MRRDWRSMESDARRHEPVLLREVLALVPEDASLVVDGTLGLGGHTRAILEAFPKVCVVAFDRDSDALETASKRLAAFASRCDLRHADFRTGLTTLDEGSADFILLDLGVSSYQLDAFDRGFSFRGDGPLDMRMDRTQGETAADIVARRSERELERILREYGEEPRASRIAREIVSARRQVRVETTAALAAVVRRIARSRPGHDAATRTFQALRIATNREFDDLEATLQIAAARLRPGGRLAVIAFHSLEERCVKLGLRAAVKSGLASWIHEKPVKPSADEERANPRSRSARLRAVSRAVDVPR